MDEHGMTLTNDASETFLAEKHFTAAKNIGVNERAASPYPLDEQALMNSPTDGGNIRRRELAPN